jgi:hypothetical protein
MLGFDFRANLSMRKVVAALNSIAMFISFLQEVIAVFLSTLLSEYKTKQLKNIKQIQTHLQKRLHLLFFTCSSKYKQGSHPKEKRRQSLFCPQTISLSKRTITEYQIHKNLKEINYTTY